MTFLRLIGLEQESGALFKSETKEANRDVVPFLERGKKKRNQQVFHDLS